MLIYLITNKVNGIQYVGCTVKKLKYRIQSHLHEATRGRGSKHSLQQAIRDFGFDNMGFKKIDEASSLQELRQKEIYWIESLNTLYPNGYNLNKGGNVFGDRKRSYKRFFEIDGKTYEGISNLAKAFGLTKKTVEARLSSNLNWTLRQVVGLEPAPKQIPLCAKEITYKGVTYPSIRHLATHLKVDVSCDTFRRRLDKGMSIEDALNPRKIKVNAKQITFKGKTFSSLQEAAKFAGINTSTLTARLSSGWSVEKAMTETKRVLPIKLFGNFYKNKMAICKHFNIDYNTFTRRVSYGLSIEQAIVSEKTEYEKRIEFTFNGETFKNKKEAAEKYGIKPHVIRKRLMRGWTPEQAFEIVERP
tara:strand:- start:78 stop:1157 length:1080 start_codon:yes stop_codon:yes gene_type:complete